MSCRLHGIDTPKLVELTALRLEDTLAVTGEKALGDKLRVAIAALRDLPTIHCDKCGARCPVAYYDHTEIGRNPQTGDKVEMRRALCDRCYKDRPR